MTRPSAVPMMKSNPAFREMTSDERATEASGLFPSTSNTVVYSRSPCTSKERSDPLVQSRNAMYGQSADAVEISSSVFSNGFPMFILSIFPQSIWYSLVN